jgi:hypothetical protein
MDLFCPDPALLSAGENLPAKQGASVLHNDARGEQRWGEWRGNGREKKRREGGKTAGRTARFLLGEVVSFCCRADAMRCTRGTPGSHGLEKHRRLRPSRRRTRHTSPHGSRTKEASTSPAPRFLDLARAGHAGLVDSGWLAGIRTSSQSGSSRPSHAES